LALRLWRNRHLGHLSNRWPIFVIVIMAVYAAQLITGLLHETPAGAADRAAAFVYVMFGVGIARAWQLLGLKAGGILDELGVGFTPSVQGAPPLLAIRPAATRAGTETANDTGSRQFRRSARAPPAGAADRGRGRGRVPDRARLLRSRYSRGVLRAG